MNVNTLTNRLLDLAQLVPDVYALYVDLAANGELDKTENLTKILDYVRNKSEKFASYASTNEVLMLVCGLLGVLHFGDSSGLYLKLLEEQAKP